MESSNFADDTVVLLRQYGQLGPMWTELKDFCATSGAALNIGKSEGLRTGPLRRSPVPLIPELCTGNINWVKTGGWIRSLGIIPFFLGIGPTNELLGRLLL